MSFKNERFLAEAVEQCQLKKILVYLKHGHNLNVRNDHGQNLLVHLLKQQHKHHDEQRRRKRVEVFKFLIADGHLSVHRLDFFGKNVFNWACNLNCTNEALYLLSICRGDLDILYRDQSGSCSLHYAIEHGNEFLVRSIVDYLLHYQLRFDIKDAYEHKPDELARKLGHHALAEYLAEACRLTIHMANEFPSYRKRRRTVNKSKFTMMTQTSSSSLSSSSSTSSLTSPSILPSPKTSLDFYSIVESKIEQAKQLNDWKMVVFLRAYQQNPEGKKIHELPKPTQQIVPANDLMLSVPKLPPIRFESVSIDDCRRFLNWMEPQLTSSYRQAFSPNYDKTMVPHISFVPTAAVQRKPSQASSSRRLSTILAFRRRESNVSQIAGMPGQDGSPRLSIPGNQK